MFVVFLIFCFFFFLLLLVRGWGKVGLEGVCVYVCVCVHSDLLVVHAVCSVSVGSKGSADEQGIQGWE